MPVTTDLEMLPQHVRYVRADGATRALRACRRTHLQLAAQDDEKTIGVVSVLHEYSIWLDVLMSQPLGDQILVEGVENEQGIRRPSDTVHELVLHC